MIKITRKAHVKENLQICNEDGTEAFVLPVDIDIDILGGKVRETVAAVGAARSRLKEHPDDVEAYGEAVIALFRLLFGEEGAAKLLTFYDGNYTEMLLDVYPFIQNDVLPKVQAASAARKAELLRYAQPKKRGLFR